MSKNVLRDNKAILKRAVDSYKGSANSISSGLFVSLLDNSLRIRFTYKDYSYSIPILGLSFIIDDSDITLVEYKGKAVICLDTKNVFNYNRLDVEGINYVMSHMGSLSATLNGVANTIWSDLDSKHSEILNDIYSFYSTKFGVFCNDKDSFAKLFVKHNMDAFGSMLSDFIDTIRVEDSHYRLSKNVYVDGGLVGLCSFSFEDNILKYPAYSKTHLDGLEIFTKSITNRDIQFNSITSYVSGKNKFKLLNDYIRIFVSLKPSGKSFTYDKSSMITLEC